jgi:hypothetical protein
MPLALNVFQTVTAVVPTTPTVVYTAPVGYTGVVLLAQISNVSVTTQTVTVVHRRTSTDTEMLNNYPIESNDTLTLFNGKLILESGDRIVLSGSNATNLKFIASILETLN